MLHENFENLQIGYIPNWNLRLALHHFTPLFLEFNVLVVSCVDSNTNVHECISAKEHFLEKECSLEIMNDMFVIENSMTALNTIIETFTGFDEIWFSNKKPAVFLGTNQLATGRVLTDKTDPYFDETLHFLRSYIPSSGMCVGLGDGVGLNYISLDFTISTTFKNLPDHQSIGKP